MPLLVASLVVMVVAFPRVAATAWDSIGNQWATFQCRHGDGDVLEMATRLLSIVAIGLPVFGTAYILVRLVRRAAARVGAATEGKAAQRPSPSSWRWPSSRGWPGPGGPRTTATARSAPTSAAPSPTCSPCPPRR